MSIVLVLVALAVVAGVALLATGRGTAMPPPNPDREPADLPEDREVHQADIDRIHFGIGLRGYRMDQVDDVLDRLALEIKVRDDMIADLERNRGIRRQPKAPVGPVEHDAANDEPEATEQRD